jgi:hypothetical protein
VDCVRHGQADDPDRALEMLIQYYQELEMIIALLVVKFGESHPGGFRYALNDEEAWRLRRELGTAEPVVIQTHELQDARFVIDVL